jgi:hypothetical protein
MSLPLIGREHAQAGVPPVMRCTSVAEETPGSVAILGIGAELSTKES